MRVAIGRDQSRNMVSFGQRSLQDGGIIIVVHGSTNYYIRTSFMTTILFFVLVAINDHNVIAW